MTLLAKLIAKEEGFFKAGTIPAIRHNPGDLTHSPNSQHPSDPNAIGTIDTDDDGWADLERQLALDADTGMTLRQAIYLWAPKDDGKNPLLYGNNPGQYLSDVLDGLHDAGYRWVGPTDPLSLVLTLQA